MLERHSLCRRARHQYPHAHLHLCLVSSPSPCVPGSSNAPAGHPPDMIRARKRQYIRMQVARMPRTALTPNLGEVRDIYLPHRSNGRQQGDEVAVEEGWSGYVEASDSVSEPTASTSNVDGRGTNLPSIHTLRLPGLRRVSDYPVDPLDSPPFPTTTTYQVPSQQHHTFLVPKQDSPYKSQDESSGDSGDVDSEDTQSGGSSPLSPDLDEQGSGLHGGCVDRRSSHCMVPQFR